MPDYFYNYYGYILSVVFIIVCFVIGFIYWLVTEKFKKGRGTIIAQYEPPRKIEPAIAEVIAKEKLTVRGIAATIIDLTLRGYLKISEDSDEEKFINRSTISFFSFRNIFRVLLILIVFFFVVVGGLLLYSNSAHVFSVDSLFFWVYIIFVFFVILPKLRNKNEKSYSITLTRAVRDEDNLRQYERYLLECIEKSGRCLCVGRRNQDIGLINSMFLNLVGLIYKETEATTHAFEKYLMPEKNFENFLGGILVFFVFFSV